MQKMLEKQKFNIGFDDSGFGYSVKINSITVDNIAFDKKEVAFVPGTNKARLTITGFDVNTTVDGAIYALWFIPLSTSTLAVKNFSVVFEVDAQSQDQVNW